MTASHVRILERPSMSAMPVEHLCDFSIDLEPAQTIVTGVGIRMTAIIKGGTVTGERLRGEVLPGGGDWLIVGSDMIVRVDIRGTIRTDDGVLIHYDARGRSTIPTDGLERLSRGERLRFEETYIRTTPQFETADERYAWLTEPVIVGYAEVSPDRVDSRLYRVL